MRKYFFILLTFFSCVLTMQDSWARKESGRAISHSFGTGESLRFHVYYNMGFVWINAGDVTMNIANQDYQGRKSFHITGLGKTAHSYEWFFKVSDRYETFLDQETLLPEKFLRDVDEGGVKFKNNVTFYQERGVALSDTSVFSIPEGTQDILSSIYYARSLDFSKLHTGDRVPFHVFLDNKVYTLQMKIDGREKITTRMGAFNAIRIVPQVIRGSIFKDEDKMTIWVSDDENHVPLRISSPILVGSIKVDLIGYENLANPFSSIVSGN